MPWTPQQKAYCVIEFAITESQTMVQRAYRRHFNLGTKAKVPSLKSIKRWLAEYRERGTSERKKKKSNKWVRTEEQEAAVIAFFRENPTTSVRTAAKLTVGNDEEGSIVETKMFPSRRTIQRILKVWLENQSN